MRQPDGCIPRVFRSWYDPVKCRHPCPEGPWVAVGPWVRGRLLPEGARVWTLPVRHMSDDDLQVAAQASHAA